MKEINCAVLGDYETGETSVLEEPLTSGAILSYEDKYMSGGSGKSGSKESDSGVKSSGMSSLQRKIPADLTKELAASIEKYALETFKVLGASGVSRIDFLVDEPAQKVYVNEINTIPGSLSYYLWEPKNKAYKNNNV